MDDVTRWALDAGTGDRDALTAFVRATQHDVHRFLVHLTGSADAEDLAQETYLRALRTLPRFAGRSSGRTWLLAVARHVAADAARAAARRPRTTDGEPEVVSSGVEGAAVLRALVAQLDPDRRAALVLTQLLGLSYAEAAQVCGCPVGTIRSRVARAREELVAALHGSATDTAPTGSPCPSTGT